LKIHLFVVPILINTLSSNEIKVSKYTKMGLFRGASSSNKVKQTTKKIDK